METPGEKPQRAWVLKVLEGVRGLSIAEMGRVDGSASKKRGSGGKAMKKGIDYAMMSVEMDGMNEDSGGNARRPPSPELGGVAELFG